MPTSDKTTAVRRPFTKSERAKVQAVQADLEWAAAELALLEIWLDSGNGPSPENWTDKMWDYYIRSRSAAVA